MNAKIISEINDPRKLFHDKNLVVLSTIMKESCPQLVPSIVDSETKSIFVNTVVCSMKQMNISDDPRVTSTTMDQYNPFGMVSIKGKVRADNWAEVEKHVG